MAKTRSPLTLLHAQVIQVLQKAESLHGPARVNTYEICRRLNKVKQRSFCHKVRERGKQRTGTFEGMWNPSGDCTNIYAKCCMISYGKVQNALRTLERRGLVSSKRARAIDLKRTGNVVQVSHDTYRFWYIEPTPPNQIRQE